MAYIPRSGLFGFLLLLAALAPSSGMAANSAAPTQLDSPSVSSGKVEPVAAESVEGRLRLISAALREREGLDPATAASDSTDGKLAWVFANGPAVGFRNGGWGNGGFRNGGWGNGGFRNGGWGNGGGFRNGGFLNRW